MHLIFARHHNMIARNLREINKDWDDEKIFQEARKIVGAQIQHITYNEFLPSVLPQRLMDHLNITLDYSGFSRKYNSSVNPTISNSFASSAFRFGHTLLPVKNIFLKNFNKIFYFLLTYRIIVYDRVLYSIYTKIKVTPNTWNFIKCYSIHLNYIKLNF